MKQKMYMQKVSFSILMAIILLFSNIQLTFAADYSSNHTFKNATLEQLIEVRDDDDNYDVAEAQRMIDRVGAIPERMLNEAVKSGVILILMDFPLTDLPEFEHLKGEVPRGWEETGLTWDYVPGAGGHTAAARIGHSDYGAGHSTINLELHELSHSLDYNMTSQNISETEEFKALQAEEQESIFEDRNYFDHTEEYFAEAMAYYYLNEETRAELQTKAPKTYHFIENLSTRILSVGNRTNTSVDLTWEPVPSATKYEVYRNQELIDTVTETNYHDSPIEKLDHYFYSIKALDSADTEISSTYEALVSNMGPNIPEDFNAVLDNYNTVTLSWTAVEEAISYILTRDGEEIARTTKLSFTDSGLAEGTSYEYAVRVVNELNEESGQFSLSIETGTASDESELKEPEGPENLEAILDNYHTVSLSWEAVENAESYVILRDGEAIDTTTELAYIDSDLNEETNYTYTIQAINEAGHSEGATVEITTGTSPVEPEEPAVKIPENPENLDANLDNYHTVNLSWDAVDNADFYTILRDGEVIDTTTELIYSDSNLNEETNYTYTIYAINEAGHSKGIIAEISTGTAPAEPELEVPSEPVNLEANLDNYHTVTLSWAVVNNADFYTILRDGKEINTTTDLTYTDNNLNEETNYTYTIYAVNEAGTSAKVVIEVKTGTAPTGPEQPLNPEPNVPEEDAVDDDETDVGGITEDDGAKDQLPSTATNMYTFLFIGTMLMIFGGLFLFIYRRQQQSAESISQF